MKIRILQAALSHMKTNACRIKGKALVEFHHEHYNHVMSEYGIPFTRARRVSCMEKSRMVDICSVIDAFLSTSITAISVILSATSNQIVASG
jgi:hypothetical protein